jgi:drug/metabolite transporter (DMT)-like permease
MPVLVFLLVLTAAVMHAAWNAMVRVGGDRFVTMVLINFAHVVLGLIAILNVPLPAPDAWPFLIGSVAIHQAYYLGVIMQYRRGDLSLVYPLARGLSPLVVTLAAWPLAGEVPGIVGGLAVLAICAGILLLTVRSLILRHDGNALGWAVFTGLCISSYTLTDGLGGRAAGETLSYIGWLFFLEGIPFVLLAPVLRRREILWPAIKAEAFRGLLGGAMSTVAYGAVIWAMSQAQMGYVSAVRETSVVFAAVIGAVFLHEPFGARRVLAAALVAAGAVLLQMSAAL